MDCVRRDYSMVVVAGNFINQGEKAILKCAEYIDSGLDLSIGSSLNEANMITLAKALADSLFDIVSGKSASELRNLSKSLLMTEPLIKIPESTESIEIMFSGGVSEYIYTDYNERFQDNAIYLANAIKTQLSRLQKYILIEPEQRIRATVVGAGQYSLSVSGSTTFVSENLKFPIRNIPVVYVPISSNMLSEMTVEIKHSLSKLDLKDGDNFALAFNDPVKPVYSNLTNFTKGLEKSLPITTAKTEFPLILIFNSDIGNSVGNVAKRETTIKSEILSLDEIALKEGDFIDIGEPIIGRNVIPVVVKTLIFND